MLCCLESMDLRELRRVSWGKSHFFDVDTMRFFDSRLCGSAQTIEVHGDKWAYFVVSNRCRWLDFPRTYQVKRVELDAWRMEDLGEFKSARAAKAAMRHVMCSHHTEVQ